MRNNFRLMLLSMATLGFFSCSDKLTDDNTTGGGDIGEQGYVAFTISNIGNETRATRAGETDEAGESDDKFDIGDDNEHAVTSLAGANVVYFFNQAGDQLDFSVLEVLGHPEADNNHDTDHTGSDKEKIYQARIKPESIKEITSCLLVLNGDPETLSGYQGKDLITMKNELKDSNLGWLDVNGTKFFTMTNTVYVGASGENNALQIQTETSVDPTTNICTTMAEAQEHPIVVHVERIRAKYSLTAAGAEDKDGNKLADENINIKDNEYVYITPTKNGNENNTQITMCWGEDYEEQTPSGAIHAKTFHTANVGWKVAIVGWGVNATETETFWFKNLENDAYKTSEKDWKFGIWEKALSSGQIGWNASDRLRSYWAVDPHYNSKSDKYPIQYRDALDITNATVGHGTEQNTLAEGLALNYLSYNTFAGNKTDIGNSGGKYRYSVENTFHYDFKTPEESTTHMFQGDEYKRVSTHLVVAAQLLVPKPESRTTTDESEDKVYGYYDGADYSARTFYQYDSYYWEAKGTYSAENKYWDMPADLKYYMLNQIIFNWTTDNAYRKIYKTCSADNELSDELTANDFETYFKIVPATVDGGDGRVMIELKGDVVLYFKDEKGDIQEIQKDKDPHDFMNLKNFTENYLYVYGTARRFDSGKMYYYIPIEHMVQPDKEKGYYSVGSYGVVRNHWYKVNIKKITKPGIPVDDPDQPIIPNDDPDADLYAAFEVVILPWHVIENDADL